MSTVSSYTLYQTLQNNAAAKPLSVKEKKILVGKISAFTPEKKIALVRLVLEHAHITDNYFDVETLPYEGKYTDNEITFDFEKLPNKLKMIIKRFADADIDCSL